MARTASTSSKEKLNKGQIIKLAEESAKKAVKKTVTKVAQEEASKVAAKVATEASLNPDYEYNDEEVRTSSYSEWDEEYDGEDYGGNSNKYDYSPLSSRQSVFLTNASDEEVEDLSQSVKNRDIFAYASDLMNKGTPVRLQIKKNGQFLTTVKKPYSEEQLQKEHGEGHYSIILRNDVKGTFIKQQSFSIAAPPVAPTEIVQQQVAKQEEKLDKMFHTFSQMQSAQTESQNQLFERLLEEQRRREEEEKERRREERELMKYNEQNNNSVLASVLQAALQPREGDGGNMSAILQVMQSQQNQTTQMIMESNKNFMMMIQEMRRDSQQMMERITQMTQEQAREFRQQLNEMSGKKQDGFDPITMFKMLNDTREAGMNFGLKINDLAKQIAEEDIHPSQPKGLVESVLDNLGKFAPLMLAAQQNAAPAGYFPSQDTQLAATSPAKLVTVPPAPSYKQPVSVKPNPAPVKAPSKTVTTTAATGAKPVVKQTTTKSNVASVTETAKINSDAELKTRVIDICVPLIGHAIQNSINTGGLGDATLKAFASQGINPRVAVSLVTVQDIYDLAFKKYSLPDVPELRHYLKDYHDYITQKAPSYESGKVAGSGN